MFSFIGGLFSGVGSFFGGLFRFKAAQVTEETVEKAIPVVESALPVVGDAIVTAGTVATAAATMAKAEAATAQAAHFSPADSKYWLVSNRRPLIELAFTTVLIGHITGFIPFFANNDQIIYFYCIAGGYLGISNTGRGLYQIISTFVGRR